MASRYQDAKGNFIVQFTGLDGTSRKTVWIGKVNENEAQLFEIRIGEILASRLTGYPFKTVTASWLASLPQKSKKKLIAVGLIEPEKPSEPEKVVTLGEFLDGYIERRSDDVKAGTLIMYGMTVRNLKDCFGVGKSLVSIHAGDADDFRRFLKKKEKLADATVNRRCQFAITLFRDAVRRKYITSNPFEGIGKGSTANPERQRFISHETIGKVIDACPNAEWKLLVALSRYGGLRVPSEPMLLRWQDVDTVDWKRMLVHSPKTEHHQGHATREVPIFPELRPYFEDVFELSADKKSLWVLPSFETLRQKAIKAGDWRHVNTRRMLVKYIERAGVELWPRIWHNLRSSRQTELTDLFPSHIVNAWLGNTEKIANKHYLQVLEAHFEKALQITCSDAQKTPETTGNQKTQIADVKRKTPEIQAQAMISGVKGMSDTGFEPVTSTV